jgi:drug/metabolite transporter (DMT)-like permease
MVMSGIGLTVASYLLFCVHDATVKWLVATVSTWQILFVRSAVILPLCFLFGGRDLLVRAATSPVRHQLALRTVVMLIAWLSYYTAARSLALAELVTLYFAAPFLVAVLAALLLRERVTWSRWTGLMIGFTGVLIACRPGDLGHAGPVALALGAAALWAYALILIRQIGFVAPTLVQMVIANLAFLVACGVSLPWQWRTPTGAEAALLLVVGLLGGAGQALLIEGIRRAPASVVAPLEFSSLIWAFALGYAIWGELPGPAVFTGAGLILVSSVLVVGAEWWRVRRRGRGAALAEA